MLGLIEKKEPFLSSKRRPHWRIRFDFAYVHMHLQMTIIPLLGNTAHDSIHKPILDLSVSV